VLTNNSIRRVENLQQLQTLEHLLLQGNQIASLDDLNLPLLVRAALLPGAPATLTSRS
jgi:Leucine-rich repeat (LRR) protein